MAKKRTPTEARAELPAPWLMFADLHLSGRTADRAFKVLSDVRSMAVEMGARVVFLGDFWDARNTLPVRLVDRLMLEMEQWEREGVRAWIIPGNHDQVTRDGMVHGLRILEPFGNLTVCHEPEHLPEERVAFLPWREDPGEQAAQVEALDGNADWLVFAHAEIEGATTNHKHLAAGRVSLALIRQHARLFFSGHYHKRQLLGDRAWYVGSPFQQDFGERDDPPKGVCFLPTLSNTPQWVELKGFPKHHRVTWTPGAFEAEVWDAIAPGDIVELYHPRDVDQGELDAFIEANVAALDVRPLPLADAPGEDAPPAFALTLDQALAQWVADSPDNTLPEADLLQIGRGAPRGGARRCHGSAHVPGHAHCERRDRGLRCHFWTGPPQSGAARSDTSTGARRRRQDGRAGRDHLGLVRPDQSAKGRLCYARAPR
jgi:hypothetical protein